MALKEPGCLGPYSRGAINFHRSLGQSMPIYFRDWRNCLRSTCGPVPKENDGDRVRGGRNDTASQLDRPWAHSEAASSITLFISQLPSLPILPPCALVPCSAGRYNNKEEKEIKDGCCAGWGKWRQFRSFQIREVLKEVYLREDDLITWHHTIYKMDSCSLSPPPPAFLKTKDMKITCSMWHGVRKEQGFKKACSRALFC